MTIMILVAIEMKMDDYEHDINSHNCGGDDHDDDDYDDDKDEQASGDDDNKATLQTFLA